MADASAGETFYEQAVRCERRGDLTGALQAYEAALAGAPEDLGTLCGLARIAGRLDMAAQGLALWVEVLAQAPHNLEAVDGQARMLAALGRAAEAVEKLRTAILAHPHEARLWNALGLLLAEQGDSGAAIAFFDEAVRLDPGFAAALYNRGDVRFDLGELAYAEADFDAGARHATEPSQAATIIFARALVCLHRGELATGWQGYAARLDPHHPAAPLFEVDGGPWRPETPLQGAHLMVVGEQGVGDEIMFAGVIGDVLEAVGLEGQVSFAVEPRLATLMQRSFPTAAVVPHVTDRRNGRAFRQAAPREGDRPVDLWAPLGELPRGFRRDAESFAAGAYLRPDPVRVRAWGAWLADRRPAVGLSWRSGLVGGRRRRQYPNLADWKPVLQVPGLSLVNLQYGATAEELAALETLAGRRILSPPELDLKADLDDLGALCSALDLVISVPNATAALAGACGAQVWFVSGPAAWTQLGTGGYPWYLKARAFTATSFEDWTPVLKSVAQALAELSK